MAIIKNTYDRKGPETVFYSETTGEPVARLSVKLSKDDFYLVMEVINSSYSSGVKAGSEERAAEIRAALGLAEGGE